MQITRAVRPKGAPQKYHVYIDPGDGLVHAQNNRTGVTDHTGSTSGVVLAALLADLGSTVATATLSDETHNLAADTTIPANVGVQAVQGTLLKPASGKTLTLNGTLDAGPYQIFDLSAGGSVVLGQGSVEAVRPEWFGAKADWNGITGTDNQAAFSAMLATGYRRYRMASGNYLFATADANGNAITVPGVASEFFGAGFARTTFTVRCTATWGVKATAAQIKCSDFSVVVDTGGVVTYGVGVSTASVGSAESCAFRDIWVGATSTGALTDGFAAGPDNAGSSSMDIAETSFFRCRSNGTCTGAGFHIGNGTAGNVLCTWMDHCCAVGGLYGVWGNKTGFVWTSGSMSRNSGYDFQADPQGIDPVVVNGVRSELSAALWNVGGSSGFMNASISNVQWFGSSIKSNGVWFVHGTGGLLTVSNVVAAETPNGNVYFEVVPNTSIIATINGLSQPNSLNAGVIVGTASPEIVVTISGYIQMSPDNSTAVATVPFTVLGSAAQVTAGALGSGFRTKEGTNGKQGTATLTAGTVTVANTSVTASSRIFLTAQDGNTTGALRVSARTAGTSFVITSSNGSDTGVVAYEIFEPA